MGSNGKEMTNFDSKPLNGLRGLASFHVLVFHSLLYTTKEEFSIYGQVHNSLIFCDYDLTQKYYGISGSNVSIFLTFWIMFDNQLWEENQYKEGKR